MITAKDNPQIKRAVLLRESTRERRAQGKFFLEGRRLCRDAFLSGYQPEALFCTEAAKRKYDVSDENVILISEAVAQKLGDTQNPQGIFGVFNAQNTTQEEFWRLYGKYIALEHVQDPGNLGGIARTAEALGVDGMLVSGGCDVYHPKALRASMGALLRLPVLECGDLCAALAACHLPCYAAVPDENAPPVTSSDFKGGAVIVIGNEGSGLSDEVQAACREKITVPMRGRAESLNAAAAATILCWELMK